MLLIAAWQLVACDLSQPSTVVEDLDWVCGAARCAVRFRLANDGMRDERVTVYIRAYDSTSVSRRKVIAQSELQASVESGEKRAFNISIDTPTPAGHLRVIVARPGS
jgi:hypothetical protein